MLATHGMWLQLPQGARPPHSEHMQQHDKRLRAQPCMPLCRAGHASSSAGAPGQLFPALAARHGGGQGWAGSHVSDAVHRHLPGRAGNRGGDAGGMPANFASRMDHSTTAAYPPHLRSSSSSSAQLLGRSSTSSAAAQLASPSSADVLRHAAASPRSGMAAAALEESSGRAEAAAVNGLAAAAADWPRTLEDRPSQEEDSHSDRVGHRCFHSRLPLHG